MLFYKGLRLDQRPQEFLEGLGMLLDKILPRSHTEGLGIDCLTVKGQALIPQVLLQLCQNGIP